MPPFPSCNGPQPLTWTRVTPSVSCFHSILGVCTTAVVLLLLYSNCGMCCALCVCLFCILFSKKTRAVLLQRAGAAVHNYSSEHFTVVRCTNYSAAPAQQYNFNAAPAQQYSPHASPPLPPVGPRCVIGGTTTASASCVHPLAGLTGWLTTQLIPYQTFSYRDPVPRYLAWAANSMHSLLGRVQ